MHELRLCHKANAVCIAVAGIGIVLCYLWQDRAREEVLLLGIIQQASERILWPMLLLVFHCLQAPVVAYVPHLQCMSLSHICLTS